MTPQDAQKLTDLRQKVLANVQAGKPSYEGIDPKELESALSLLRQPRAAGAAEGGKKTAAKRTKATTDKGVAASLSAPSDAEAAASLDAKLKKGKFANLDLG